MFWKKQWKWFIPFPILSMLPFCSTWDLTVAHYFHHDHGWVVHPLADFFYRYGEQAGFAAMFFALGAWLPYFWSKSTRSFGYEAQIFVLTICVGAGVITNSLCKGYLGRPRPKQLIEFGGTHRYHPPGSFNLDPSREKQASFPSGHVAMGSSYLALVLVPTKRRWLAPLGWVLFLFWGGSLMVVRMAQGGHFLSDVLVSPCIMWWTALTLISIFPPENDLSKRLEKVRDIPNLIRKKAKENSVTDHTTQMPQKHP